MICENKNIKIRGRYSLISVNLLKYGYYFFQKIVPK